MMKEVVDQRAEQLKSWVIEQLMLQATGDSTVNVQNLEMQIISGDASFRRYFRIRGFESGELDPDLSISSLIAVDAPVETEDSRTFIAVAGEFSRIGLQVPQICAADLSAGWMLLSDMGDTLYSQFVDTCKANNDHQLINEYYHKAIDALVCIQACSSEQFVLPDYTVERFLQEMNLFREWFCDKLLVMSLSQQDHQLLSKLFQQLADRATKQLQVCTHRDYHSRNLMVLKDLASSPGILDFQGALYGPVSYDLVSLLKDCYICWPDQQLTQWLNYYLQVAGLAGIQLPDEDNFWQDFDWMGLQRHFKVVGIFSRLFIRDGKSGYLQDIPLTLNYIHKGLIKYPQLQEFAGFIESCITKFAVEYPGFFINKSDR